MLIFIICRHYLTVSFIGASLIRVIWVSFVLICVIGFNSSHLSFNIYLYIYLYVLQKLTDSTVERIDNSLLPFTIMHHLA